MPRRIKTLNVSQNRTKKTNKINKTVINIILSKIAARFQQQFPDWAPCKPFSVLQSVMRPDNDGTFHKRFINITLP